MKLKKKEEIRLLFIKIEKDVNNPYQRNIQKVSKLFATDRTRSSLKVSVKKKLASTLLRSETREDLSLTRAKVSSMLMKLSDVKLVRLVRNN